MQSQKTLKFYGAHPSGQSQKLLNEHYVSLAENNIHFGMATVVCVGFNKWALPGGQIIESQHKARKAAEKLNAAMGGK